MEESRISVYGKDTEDHYKRAFDWVMINNLPYVETVNSKGLKIRTPAADAISAYKRLKQQYKASA